MGSSARPACLLRNPDSLLLLFSLCKNSTQYFTAVEKDREVQSTFYFLILLVEGGDQGDVLSMTPFPTPICQFLHLIFIGFPSRSSGQSATCHHYFSNAHLSSDSLHCCYISRKVLARSILIEKR